MNIPEKAIIHHTAVSTPGHQFEAVNNYHKSLGFPKSSLGYYCGYHKFYETDGTVIIAREDWEEGAHTLLGWNKKSLGHCLAGNFDVDRPPEAGIASLRVELAKDGLPYLLHREADTRRTCPGRFFSKELLEFTEIDEIDTEKTRALQKEVDRLQKENSELRKIRDFWNSFIIKFFKKND